MKKILLAMFTAATALTSQADWEGDGYYRFKNYMTERTAYLTDRHASIDYSATKVDLSAIELWLGDEKYLSDPSSVLYLTGVGGGKYDLSGQGCSVYSMIGDYLQLYKDSKTGYYYAYGQSSGMTKYLGDPDPYDTEMSYMSDSSKGNYRLWDLRPVKEADNANFFGLKPCVEVGGNHYAQTFAAFPYALGNDMEACYVTIVDKLRAVAVYKPLGNDKVAGAAPVFVKCAGAQPSDNRLTLLPNGGSKPENNLLKGNYFDSNRPNHVSCTAYNKDAMRVLGVTDKGELGYITADYDVIPRNISYLPVESGTPSQLRLVTEDEYSELVAGVSSVVEDAGISVSGRVLLNGNGEHITVFSILGMLVYEGNSPEITLSPSVYIVKTKNASTKVIIK